MRFVIFTHSLISDWNHGNAHFLRGIAAELLSRGFDLRIYEPLGGWSLKNLMAEQGAGAVRDFELAFPNLRSAFYDFDSLDLNCALEGASVVLVHEWNDSALVAAIGKHRVSKGGYRLFFHDTHHRLATAPKEMEAYDLRHYDGVLAYGQVLRDLYLGQPVRDALTWHEAADTRTFYPRPPVPQRDDLVWIGNWGDEERTAQLREFLIEPVKRLGLRASVYGVRYPACALRELEAAGIQYKGWLPNYRVPEVFARHRVTIHIPRGPYVAALSGIPTIRPFEALACGIPLISAPWDDCEHLFQAGRDFLMARDGREMTCLLERTLGNDDLAAALSQSGLRQILSRHTCSHRVDELLAIAAREAA